MQKLLLVHNYYKTPNIGDKDFVFDNEPEILKQKLEEKSIHKHCYKMVDDYYNPNNQCQLIKSLLK